MAIGRNTACHVIEQDQRLGALIGLHFRQLQARLCAGEPEQPDRENDDRDQHFDHRRAGQLPAVRDWARRYHFDATPARVLSPSLFSTRSPSVA